MMQAASMRTMRCDKRGTSEHLSRGLNNLHLFKLGQPCKADWVRIQARPVQGRN
jgi:hypothetical protein